VNLARALSIAGFIDEEELGWLANQSSTRKCIVEIGSYQGRSTRAMLDNSEAIVHVFDDWKGPREINIPDRDKIFQRFLDNTSDKLNQLVITSGDFSWSYQKQAHITPDMVFIDGSHEYKDVKRDIEFWKPLMASGGLMCGHDANWDCVMRAALEVLGGVEVVAGTKLWWNFVNRDN
jgi:predicted O-methyltransferase YrrM